MFSDSAKYRVCFSSENVPKCILVMRYLMLSSDFEVFSDEMVLHRDLFLAGRQWWDEYGREALRHDATCLFFSSISPVRDAKVIFEKIIEKNIRWGARIGYKFVVLTKPRGQVVIVAVTS